MSSVKYCHNTGAVISINQLSTLDECKISSIIRGLSYQENVNPTILNSLSERASLAELLFSCFELNITNSYIENILQEVGVSEDIFNSLKYIIQLIIESDDLITTPGFFRINFYNTSNNQYPMFSKCKLSMAQLLNLLTFIQDTADIPFKVFVGKVTKNSNLYMFLNRIITALPKSDILLVSALNLDLKQLNVLNSPIYSKCKYIYLHKNIPYINVTLFNKLSLDGYMDVNYLEGLSLSEETLNVICSTNNEYPIGFNAVSKQLYLQHNIEGSVLYESLATEQLSVDRVLYPLINYLGYYLCLIEINTTYGKLYISY